MIKRIIVFCILLLAVFLSLYLNKKDDISHDFPISIYLIDYQLAGNKDWYEEIVLDSIKYIGKADINKNDTISYSETLYNTNMNYKVFILFLKSWITDKKACTLTTYHFFKPVFDKSHDARKETIPYAYNGKYSFKQMWAIKKDTYYPSKEFFQCLYDSGYNVSNKIGYEYEKNSWVYEQHPYDLISELTVSNNPPFLIKGFDGKYYSVPKEIKKHVKEWQRKHPATPTN